MPAEQQEQPVAEQPPVEGELPQGVDMGGDGQVPMQDDMDPGQMDQQQVPQQIDMDEAAAMQMQQQMMADPNQQQQYMQGQPGEMQPGQYTQEEIEQFQQQQQQMMEEQQIAEQRQNYYDSIETDEFVMPNKFDVEIRLADNQVSSPLQTKANHLSHRSKSSQSPSKSSRDQSHTLEVSATTRLASPSTTRSPRLIRLPTTIQTRLSAKSRPTSTRPSQLS